MDVRQTRIQHLRQKYQTGVHFYVNQDEIYLENVSPRTLLAEWLRDNGYTGTKISCGQGGCGACTVMLSSYNSRTRTVEHRPINACMRPVCAIDGMQITTVEGVGSVNTELNPIQRNLAVHDGSQCGYCSPGFVMNMYSMLQVNPHPTQEQIENRFDGNLCRCTGYRPILYAMRKLAQDPPPHDQLTCIPLPEQDAATNHTPTHHFPEALKSYTHTPLFLQDGNLLWYRPLTLSEVYALKKQYAGLPGGVKLVVGNTSIGIYPDTATVYIDVSLIPELTDYDITGSYLYAGGSVTIASFMQLLDHAIATLNPDFTRGFVAMRAHLQRLANEMVRSAGSLAGNLMLVKNHEPAGTGEPFPSDLFLTIAMLGGSVTVGSTTYPNGQMTYPILQMPLVSQLPTDFVILNILLPYSTQGQLFTSYKVARRLQNAHAIVNAGFMVELNAAGYVLNSRLVYGGLQRVPITIPSVSALLQGRFWGDNNLLQAAVNAITQFANQLPLYPNDEGFTDEYRRELVTTLFYKFYVAVTLQTFPQDVAQNNVSAGAVYPRPLSTGQQSFTIYKDEEPISDPIMKFGAFLQTTGEAKYTQDMPVPQGGYEGYFVLSTRAAATYQYRLNLETLISLLKQDFEDFIDYLTVRDIPAGGTNAIGLGADDLIFANGTVTGYGQQIGLVIAKTHNTAKEIAELIQSAYILYNDQPAILTIPDAIKNNSFFRDQPPYNTHIHAITRKDSNMNWLNNPTYPLQTGDRVITGMQTSGSQAHFYMEPQITIVAPSEGVGLLVYSSTQDQATVQNDIAQVLNLRRNQVSVYVKRLGGGFGGKETRPPMIACAAAVAAYKLKRPIRLALEREADMWTIGKRHDMLGQYSLSIGNDLVIHGWKTQFYTDGGMTYDVSFPVMDLIVLSADNAYMVNTFQSKGDVCRTNKASNTAMRSFGVIQMSLVVEEAIERAAYELGKRPEEIREANFYAPNLVPPFQTAPYGASLQKCLVQEVWYKLKADCDFDNRRKAVDEFNAKNRWCKRGISIMPLKYGVSYTAVILDQGGALINVYDMDGTILIHHGGVEMGQGIHTKIAQVAAFQLNVPITKIRMGGNLTDVIPNTSSTGASTGTDLNGGAVIEAADKLRVRLEEFLNKLRAEKGDQWCHDNGVDYWNYPTGWNTIVTVNGRETLMWDNVVGQAYGNRIDLSSQAFFRYPYITDVTNENPYGTPFFYYNYAAGCSEVEIDILTGEFTILRTDILYDAGQSLNPCVDIGQIEGGFIQGVGYMTTEEIVFNDAGQLVTDNTWTYKPPDSKTIPVDFRVNILNSARFALATGEEISPTSGIKSSKTTGEPPLVLSNTVFFAIKHAILAARQDQGVAGWFEMPAPATVQTIQTLCRVNDANMLLNNAIVAGGKPKPPKPAKPDNGKKKDKEAGGKKKKKQDD